MSALRVEIALERRPKRAIPFRLDVSFASRADITVVFGPSGSGKSTLLLAILGAIRPDRGRILLGERRLFDSEARVDVPVRRRRVGIVFQDALLFPHLDVKGNVAFGLPRDDRREREHRVGEALEQVEGLDLATRMPSELSGGQRQRVALARALAAKPATLLLDEPFSALDAPARESLGSMLVALQAETGVPFLHVTHDLGEAIRLGTELVVLDAGRVVQAGLPAQVVAQPASAATARALGTENLFTGTVQRHFTEEGHSAVDLGGTLVETGLIPDPPGSKVALALRAEDVLMSLEPVRGTSARNVLAGTVQSVGQRGPAVEVRVATPVVFRVLVTPVAARELELAQGRPVFLLIKAHAFHRLV